MQFSIYKIMRVDLAIEDLRVLNLFQRFIEDSIKNPNEEHKFFFFFYSLFDEMSRLKGASVL